MIDRRSCQHLISGTFAKHATLRFDTVPDSENTTDYRGHLELVLCVLCSGYALGRVGELLASEVLASEQVSAS